MSKRTITVSMTMLRKLLKLPPNARIRARMAMQLLGSDDVLYVDVLPDTKGGAR